MSCMASTSSAALPTPTVHGLNKCLLEFGTRSSQQREQLINDGTITHTSLLGDFIDGS